MSRLHRLGMLLGLAVMAGASCDTQSQTECHREAVERLGCCPTCDADCRATVSQECAQVHDLPLTQEELDEEAELEDEDEPNDDGPDDEVRPD